MYELNLNSLDGNVNQIVEMAREYNLLVNGDSLRYGGEFLRPNASSVNPIIDLPKKVIEEFITHGVRVVEEYITQNFVDISNSKWLSMHGRTIHLNGMWYMSETMYANAVERHKKELTDTSNDQRLISHTETPKEDTMLVLSGQSVMVLAYTSIKQGPITHGSATLTDIVHLMVGREVRRCTVAELKMMTITRELQPREHLSIHGRARNMNQWSR